MYSTFIQKQYKSVKIVLDIWMMLLNLYFFIMNLLNRLGFSFNPYRILEVPSNATENELKVAKLKLSKKVINFLNHFVILLFKTCSRDNGSQLYKQLDCNL